MRPDTSPKALAGRPNGLGLLHELLSEVMGLQAAHGAQLVGFGHEVLGHTLGEENVLDGDSATEHSIEGALGDLVNMADTARRRAHGLRRYLLELQVQLGLAGDTVTSAPRGEASAPRRIDGISDQGREKMRAEHEAAEATLRKLGYPTVEDFGDAVLAAVLPRIEAHVRELKASSKRKAARRRRRIEAYARELKASSKR